MRIDIFVHTALHTVPHLFAPGLGAAPTGLTDVGGRNAERGLTTPLVPSCPEESWICFWGWKVEAERRGNNSVHGRELWDKNMGDIFEPQQECPS